MSVIVGVGAATALVLLALNENMQHFRSPSQVVNGEIPEQAVFRVGGMVVEDSVSRDAESLRVSFAVTDYAHQVTIEYEGILPDLFRECQGIVAQGAMNDAGIFVADEVLAKHDEAYMPPEIADTLQAERRGCEPS